MTLSTSLAVRMPQSGVTNVGDAFDDDGGDTACFDGVVVPEPVDAVVPPEEAAVVDDAFDDEEPHAARTATTPIAVTQASLRETARGAKTMTDLLGLLILTFRMRPRNRSVSGPVTR
jgi:hypothetical protein